MGNSYLFPKLQISKAIQIFESVKHQSISQLTGAAGTTHADAVFAATGGARVPDIVLRSTRNRLLELADRLGFPGTISKKQASTFDAEAALLVYRDLPICPGEANRDEVWSFLTLVLLPDIARWRFPLSNERRFIGGVRNVFQRLWWRAHALVDVRSTDALHVLMRLPEDAMVSIMERPGISSNQDVARALARQTLVQADALPRSLVEDVLRDAYKRVRQRVPVTNFDALEAGELERQLEGIFQMAAKALTQAHS